MTSDAKLGLLAGLATVLLIAVVYHRKQQSDGTLPARDNPPKVSTPLPPPVSVVPRFASEPDPNATPVDPLLRGTIE